ncbi:MAG: MFS transporter, partial [Spirochaetota bacterium]
MSKWFYGGLPRSVYVLFVARIINRLGDFVRFFLTLYMTRVLGMTETSTGLVVTLASAAVMAGTLGGGKFADLFGRKRIMLISQILSAAVIGFCGFIPAHAALPALLIVSQFFLGALRPASGALVMDLTPPEKRQRAFSLLYLGINIGVALGPMIAGFLFENYRRWIFFGDAITTMAGVFLVWRFVPETSHATAYRSEDHRERSFDGSTFRAFLNRPVLTVFTGILVVTSMVYSQFHFGLPLLVNEVYPDNSA